MTKVLHLGSPTHERVKKWALGHWWTIEPLVRHTLFPDFAPPSIRWSVKGPDYAISGRLRAQGNSDLLVLVHGLGGSHESFYMHAAALRGDRMGLDVLRLNLAGADHNADTFYHAGFHNDLRLALQSPSLAGYRNIYVMGFSLGGHITLRGACEGLDTRVRAVAAISPPLDIGESVRAIDRWLDAVYRQHVLGGLKAMYTSVYERVGGPISKEEALRITKIADWDEHVVAPTHGFDSARHYWESESIGSNIAQVDLPALLVVSRHDPMVKYGTVKPSLAHASPSTLVRTVGQGGGHVSIARINLELPGMAGTGDVQTQVIAWLKAQGRKRG